MKFAHAYRLRSVTEEVQYLSADMGTEAEVVQLSGQLDRRDGVKSGAVVNEQHPHIVVWFLQV